MSSIQPKTDGLLLLSVATQWPNKPRRWMAQLLPIRLPRHHARTCARHIDTSPAAQPAPSPSVEWCWCGDSAGSRAARAPQRKAAAAGGLTCARDRGPQGAATCKRPSTRAQRGNAASHSRADQRRRAFGGHSWRWQGKVTRIDCSNMHAKCQFSLL
jgi:hypothetical protein